WTCSSFYRETSGTIFECFAAWARFRAWLAVCSLERARDTTQRPAISERRACEGSLHSRRSRCPRIALLLGDPCLGAPLHGPLSSNGQQPTCKSGLPS